MLREQGNLPRALALFRDLQIELEQLLEERVVLEAKVALEFSESICVLFSDLLNPSVDAWNADVSLQ